MAAERIAVWDGNYYALEVMANYGVEGAVRAGIAAEVGEVEDVEERRIGDVYLKVEDLTLPRAGGGYRLDHVSFELRKGEVLGFYGLMGAGRSDLVDCLAGDLPKATGRVWLDGEPVTETTISGRIQSGFVLVPEDRQRDGLIPPLSVMDNMLLASLKKYLRGIFLAPAREKSATDSQIEGLSIRVANPQQPITALSGGNQQKVLLARLLEAQPAVVILDEPTRGVDVGAKSEIYRLIDRLAA